MSSRRQKAKLEEKERRGEEGGGSMPEGKTPTPPVEEAGDMPSVLESIYHFKPITNWGPHLLHQTLHWDFSRREHEPANLSFPLVITEGNSMLHIRFVGCRYGALMPGSACSVGVALPKFEGKVCFDGRNVAFTIPCAGQLSEPQIIFADENHGYIRDMFPHLSEEQYELGVTELPRHGSRALMVEKDLCPLGYLMKLEEDQKGNDLKLKAFGDDMCLVVSEESYQDWFKTFKLGLKVSNMKIFPRDDKITVEPANVNARLPFAGCMILDVIYTVI